MKPAKALSCVLPALFFSAALLAQGRVAVFTPLADGSISALVKKSVQATFEECLSAPGSGYEVYDREHTDAVLKELGEQRAALYDEASAIEIGGRLGVQHVCISELLKEGGAILISCKLIDVKTGRAKTGTEFVDGGGAKEIMGASQRLMNRVLGRGGAAMPVSQPAGGRTRPAAASPTAVRKTARNVTGKVAVALPQHDVLKGSAAPANQKMYGDISVMVAETMKDCIANSGNGIELADGAVPRGGEAVQGSYDLGVYDGYMNLAFYELGNLSLCRDRAKQLGADYVVVSNIKSISDSSLIESRLIDVKSGRMLRFVSETVGDSKNFGGHQEAAEALVRKLLAPL